MVQTSSPVEYRPRSRLFQGIAGAFVFAVGVGVLWLDWLGAVRYATFSPGGAFLGSLMAAAGFGLMAFGGYREERIARGERVEGLEEKQLVTPRWWGVLAGGLVFGAVYAVALWQGWIGR